MDRLTIIPSDGAVYVDLVALDGFDLSFIPIDVHALQWFTATGWIEHIDSTNVPITELPDWAIQSMVLWQEKWDEMNQPPEPEPLTLNDYTNAIKQKMDEVAQEKNYDNAMSIASYAQSTNLIWKNEAETFIAWRDSVWIYLYQLFAEYQEGGIPIPSIESVIDGAPQIVWY